MNKILLAVTLALSSISVSKAQTIDASLFNSQASLTDLDAVILFDRTDFHVIDIGHSETTRHWAVMIFNENAARAHGSFMAYYDNFSSLEDVKGYLIGHGGEVLDKIRRRDIEKSDASALSYGISDNKIYAADFSDERHEYPYVVEYSYTKKNTNMMFYPSWFPLSDEKTKVLSSSFGIKTENIPFRVKEMNIDRADILKKIDGEFDKKWVISNVEPIDFEEYSKNENLPEVRTAPIAFTVDGYTGELKTWEDISVFYNELNKGRDALPAATVAKAKNLIKPGMDVPAKTKAIYEFMQSHTRYMSIQLGIGGWQTMPAMEVAENGFGDCKALTNYSIALLKSVGVTAYPALIRAGERYSGMEDEDFPSMRFNHVIAFVPMEKDTIWLECTSQTNAMGYMSDFTGNRKALTIAANGGALVNTRQYLPNENLQARTAEVWLGSDGQAEVKIASKYAGLQQDRRAYIIKNQDKEEQEKFLKKTINISSFDLGEFSLKQEKKAVPEVLETVELKARKVASSSGKRIFLKPNLLSSFYKTPPKKEERETKLFLSPNTYTFEDTDEIIFHLPEDLTTERMLKPKEIKSKFGTYKCSAEREGDILKYHRKVSITGGSYSKESYDEWAGFVKAINRADRQKIVFVSGGT